MAAPELRDDLRARVPAGAAERPEGGDAALELALLDDGLARLGDRRERLLGVRAQGAGRLGRPDAAADAGEERQAELGSSRRICSLNDGCARCSRCAAAENDPSSRAARKYSSCCRVMLVSSRGSLWMTKGTKARGTGTYVRY